MTNKFLSTVGAMALFGLLVSFGVNSATASPSARLPAKSISEIPITHHFSQRATVGFIGGGSPPPVSTTMPNDGGIAICQFNWLGSAGVGNPNNAITVKINGVETFKRYLTAGDNGDYTSTIYPPLIVPPGASLQIGTEGAPGNSVDLTITGYTLEAAAFGGP